ncbi:MAG: hypothetical protein NTW10_11080 [Bacteroidetes bacterium]|nr:hypothetical protein [Bacteroidota bacterium]
MFCSCFLQPALVAEALTFSIYGCRFRKVFGLSGKRIYELW